MKVYTTKKAYLKEVFEEDFSDINNSNLKVGYDFHIEVKGILDYLKNSDKVKSITSVSGDTLEGIKDVSEALFEDFDLLVLQMRENGEILNNIKGTSFDNLMTEQDGIKSIGLKKIMSAKKLIIFAQNNIPKDIYELLNGLRTEDFPSSILVEHPDATLIIDEKNAELL